MDITLGAIRQMTRQYGVLLLSIIVLILVTMYTVRHFGQSNSLAVLALIGVVVLLSALLVFTCLMTVAGLSDKTQALGLPDGSVRAIIAIALVGMFAILAASVLTPVGFEEVTKTGMTQADITRFKLDNPNQKNVVVQTTSPPETADKVYTLSFLSSSAKTLDEFSKQMLTLLGTLMTALTAFYFGGRTAASASGGDILKTAPQLTGIDDNGGVVNGMSAPTPDPLTLTLTGLNFNNIVSARLATGSAPPVEAVAVLTNSNKATCTFPARPDFNKAGIWDITVADDAGRASTKTGLLTFALATGAPSEPPVNSASSKVAPSPATAITSEFSVTGNGLKETNAVFLKLGDSDWLQATITGDNTDNKVTFKPPADFKSGSWQVRLSIGSATPVILDQPLVVQT